MDKLHERLVTRTSPALHYILFIISKCCMFSYYSLSLFYCNSSTAPTPGQGLRAEDGERPVQRLTSDRGRGAAARGALRTCWKDRGRQFPENS